VVLLYTKFDNKKSSLINVFQHNFNGKLINLRGLFIFGHPIYTTRHD